jgi:hypothetical protein
MPVIVPGGKADADTTMRAWIGRQADDVPQGWMDHVIRRMLDLANCQLLRLEHVKEEDFDKNQVDKELDLVERKASILARVSRNFRMLIEFETERARQRVNLRVPSNEGARDALIRHVTKVLGPEYALEIPERAGE